MSPQDLQVQEKKTAEEQGEKTEVGSFYAPHTDIHESADALLVSMEMPGVSRDKVDIKLEKNVLSITGKVDFSGYEGLKPLYTEYNVGHFTRSFSVSSDVDQAGITAQMADGVLAVKLPKAKQAQARKIEVA